MFDTLCHRKVKNEKLARLTLKGLFTPAIFAAVSSGKTHAYKSQAYTTMVLIYS
jgi:hypothetical protein